MRGTLVLLAALCLAGNLGVSGGDAMGRLHWCNTLCMCRDSTQVEVKCFERSDIYELLGFGRIQVFKLERTNWKLENQVEWCNDTCLCHQNTNPKVFRCIDEESLHQFISEKIGDMYFYVDEEVSDGRGVEGGEEEEVEVQTQEIEHQKRSEERRRNGRKRKSRKRGKGKHERPPAVVTEKTMTTTTLTPEVTEVVTTPPPTEVVSVTTTPEVFSHPPTPTLEILTFEMPTQVPPLVTTTSETTTTFLATEQTPFESWQKQHETEMVDEDENHEEEEEEEEEEEDEAELLPKHEAVAASPAVTAMQPPTRRQPFPPPTASSHAATNRKTETLAPKVSAVLEVPVQKKTVASEVSQDLEGLGSAVMQIKSDVVLNQRILLVTVVVAGIAMLGVLLLAVHGCLASKRQAAAEERRKNESPKADNHVTKVNLEEAW